MRSPGRLQDAGSQAAQVEGMLRCCKHVPRHDEGETDMRGCYCVGRPDGTAAIRCYQQLVKEMSWSSAVRTREQ